MSTQHLNKILSQDVRDKLFNPERHLIPNLNDFYELELAFYEDKLLDENELVQNGAYFSRVGHKYTRHFLMCIGESLKLPQFASSRLKSFFEKNIFRTGYATHGLFPYRGKFHPQMIKGLINIMGLKPGDIVLDPMMGSGTVLIEACLMGVNSIGIDSSPFCRFMTQAKIDALTMSLDRIRNALSNYDEVYEYFQNKVGKPEAGSKAKGTKLSLNLGKVMERETAYSKKNYRMRSRDDKAFFETYNLLLLAYLDSVGYSERSGRKSPVNQFKAILERYLFATEKIQRVLSKLEIKPAGVKVIEADARSLPVDDSSIDGILFSPPYSFAIDYLSNDSFHLNFLGVDIVNLRERMIGLRGRKLLDKVTLYFEDMNKVLSECSRVLRPGKVCTIVVGTNNNQLGKAFGILPSEVRGIHEMLIDIGATHNLALIKMFNRPITGISNTMRNEYIIMLSKN